MDCDNLIRFTIADWGGHCRSEIGRQDAQPTVVTLMVDKCLRSEDDVVIIKHELLHALGHYHEHTR